MRCATAICLLVLASALSATAQDKQPTPPSYCKPCLFYGGDFDPNGPSPNALWNGDDLLAQGVVYVPFAVPPNQTWTVTGLFSNNLVTRANLAPPQIEWSISNGISQGNAGTVIASGITKASLAPTGRSFSGMDEYTALGLLNQNELVTLGPGHYWMMAAPVCTFNAPPQFLCGGAEYYITDVEDVPAPHAKGFESTDESYLNWPGSYNFVETGGTSGLCDQEGGGGGCDKFSAGLLGTAQLN
jgi:hypothetical protein